MKLQQKVLFGQIAATALSGAFILYFSKGAISNILFESAAKRGFLVIEESAARFAPGFKSKNEKALLPLLQGVAVPLDAPYAMALDNSGTVVAHTNVLEKGKLLGDRVTREGLLSDRPLSRVIRFNGKDVLDLVEPIWAQDEDFLLSQEKEGRTRLGTLRVAIPLEAAAATQAMILRRIASILGLASLLLLAAIFPFFRRMLLPVRLLADSASRIGSGQQGIMVPVTSNDELGELTRSFNAMSQSLASTTVSKDYLDGVLRNIVDILIVTDPQGNIRSVNRAGLEQLGYGEGELIGQPAPRLFQSKDGPGGDAAHVFTGAHLETLLNRGFIKDVELIMRTKVGEAFPVLLSGSMLREGQGGFGGLVIVAKDLTARAKAAKELEDALALVAATLEATADGILVADLKGRILNFNQKFLQMCRIPKENASLSDGHGITEHILAQVKDPERYAERVREIYSLPENSSFDVIEFSEGRVFERHSQPHRVAGALVGRVWDFRDVSERKRMESVLMQSEKLSAVGQLAAGVSHEINNPLGIILGFAQSAMKRVKPDDALFLPMKSIEREAVRCKTLVQNLLAFSRRSNSKMERLDLNETARATLSIIEAQAKVHAVEILQELGSIGPMTGDKTQVQQVLFNLCTNAIDAMPQGGKITVRTRKAGRASAPGVILSVEDTGTGIPEDIRDQIFNPFFTTKEVGKGTGLGLSLVYEIVQRHGGTIDVKSEVGKGTVFFVFFPETVPPPKG